MHRLFRHFFATVVTVTIFTATGTLTGFLHLLARAPHADPRTPLALNGLVNFFTVLVLILVVLMPVTSIADYLFTHHWPAPVYIQLPTVALMLPVYLLPWCALFGRAFFWAWWAGCFSLILPLLVYWGVFCISDRERE